MKIGPLLFSLLLLTAVTSAQTKFGIQAGPQISYRTGFPSDLDLNTKALFSFQAGLFIEQKISNNFILRPLLAFSNKGMVFKDVQITDQLGNSIGTADLHSTISYLELLVPFLFQLKSNGDVGFYTGAGPWFAYALSGKETPKNYEGMGNPVSNDIDMDDINRVDIGATVQVLVNFSKQWQAGLQFNPGFTKITDGGGWQNKNNSFVLSVGYVLR